MVLICDFRQSKYSHSRMHTWNETFIRYQNETWKKCWECREIPTIADHDQKGHAFSSSFVEAVRDCLLVLCAWVRRYCSLPENPLRGLLLVLLFEDVKRAIHLCTVHLLQRVKPSTSHDKMKLWDFCRDAQRKHGLTPPVIHTTCNLTGAQPNDTDWVLFLAFLL